LAEKQLNWEDLHIVLRENHWPEASELINRMQKTA
jgi:hypothetical protein